jgi:hypothetical protein
MKVRQSPRDTKVKWSVGLATLILFILFLFVPGVWPKLILGVIVFLLFDYLLVTHLIPGRPSFRNWLVERGTAFVALPLVVALALAFALWIVVNFFWATDEALTTSEGTSGRTGNVEIHASAVYPRVALVDATDDELQLGFSPVVDGAALPNTELTALVRAGEGLIFPGAIMLEERPVVIELGPYDPATWRIGLVNGQTYPWFRADTTLEVELIDTAGRPFGEVMRVPVVVEGEWGFAVRRFVNSTINEASPLIFLLLLVLPGLAALVQRTLDQRFEELKVRRKQKFENLVTEFRDRFLAEDRKGANDAWEKMNEREYKDIVSDDREMVRRLLAFINWKIPQKNDDQSAESEKVDTRILTMGPRWPKEFVVACALANVRLKELKKSTDESADRKIEKEKLLSPYQTLVKDAKEMVLNWTFPDDQRLEMKLLHLRYDHSIGYPFKQTRIIYRRSLSHSTPANNYYISSDSLAWAFSRDDAAETAEQEFLREGDAFWPKNPILERDLRAIKNHTLVYGSPGSGRTALAAMLPHPTVYQTNELYVRLDSTKRLPDAVAKELQLFLLEHPTVLRRYDLTDKELLADFLVSHLGLNSLIFDIERAQESVAHIHELKTEVIQTEARELLQLFKRVVQAKGAKELPKRLTADRLVFLECTRALEFERIVILIEGGIQQSNWLRRAVLSNLDSWQAEGVYACLFAQDESFINDEKIGSRFNRFRLGWEVDDLRKMVEWRYERYLRLSGIVKNALGRKALRGCFKSDEEGLRLLLEGSTIGNSSDAYNPRRFMQLWRKIVGQSKTISTVITDDDIQLAVEWLKDKEQS